MKIICVLVTYNPDVSQLKDCVVSLLPQSEKIIIVKNSDERLDDADFQGEKIEQVQLDKNFGIAYAQNRGIESAIDMGAEWILFSDQDTRYPENYVDSFFPFIKNKKADIFCPVFYDLVKNEYCPVMIKKFKSLKKVLEPTFVQHAISSGTLVNVKSFKTAGLMNEKLFIDYVDFEWCWRAVSKGLKILQIPSIIVNHYLGNDTKKILNHKVTIRSNARYYYIIRNGFYLSFYCEFLTVFEKVRLFLKSVKFCIGVFLLRHSFSIMKLCLQAFEDALSKNLGSMGDQK